MAAISDLIKVLFVPGSTSVLVAVVALATLLLYGRRTAPWGRRLLVAVSLLYLLLSMPLVSQFLVRGARPTYPQIASRADAKGATTLVLLGNGIVTYTDGTSVVPTLTRHTAYSTMEAARLFRLLDPERFIVSGGIVVPGTQLRSEAEAMADVLERAGIPRDRMTLDTQSVNTYEQSIAIRQMTGPGARLVLITSPIHMARALALFEARGLHPIPAPSRVDYWPPQLGTIARLIPAPGALRASELVAYEYLAEMNGQMRGWFARNDVPQ